MNSDLANINIDNLTSNFDDPAQAPPSMHMQTLYVMDTMQIKIVEYA